MADPTYDAFGRQSTNPDNEMPAASTTVPSRGGTLKKKNSIKRKSSVKRSSSRAGSVRSAQMEPENKSSIFYTPVPTRTNPTEALVGRFTAWRKVLKDFIAYFREVQSQYEARARGISRVTATLNQATIPADFLTSGGILETNNVLRDFHHEVTANSQFAAQIETDIIKNLLGLRNDLSQKIKEIKGLSGDFKNNIDKEKEAMKKEVAKLQDELEAMDRNPAGGKDPYVTRVTVEKQLRHYLTEENYLHRAYLNLESSGRELERIVVGEIQKSYNVYVGILAKEGRELIDVSERLTASTLHLPPDYEWNAFVERDTKMVNPEERIRSFEDIEYPGCHHPAALEVKAGTLERKSKYLKSFTAAWYVLSPTHLHEFKTEDRGRDTSPVLSLYLPDSTLGKHSDPAAVSQKFVVKGKQTGTMHRGHSWVFRAETHEAMMDWYEAIKKLTEITGRERDTFVAGVAQRQRAVSSASKADLDSNSSEFGLDNDEADDVPYSGQVSNVGHPQEDEEILQPPVRPEGGRFPSDINVNRFATQAESVSGESSNEAMASVSAHPGAVGAFGTYDPQQAYTEDQYQAQQAQQSQQFSEEPSYAKQTALMSGAAMAGAAMSGGAHDSTYDSIQPPQDTNAYSTPPDAQNSTYVASQTEQPNYPTQSSNPTLQQTRGGDHIVVVGPMQTTHQREQEPLPVDNYPTDQTGQIASRPDMSNLATYSQQRTPLAGAAYAPSQSADMYDTRDEPQVSETGNMLGYENVPVASGPNQPVLPSTASGAQEYLVPEGRPTSLRGDSVNTISNLHVPGEYPRKT